MRPAGAQTIGATPNMKAQRLALAVAVTCLTPALLYLWLQFFVSGATFYQGRREWGHVYKYLSMFFSFGFPVSLVGTLLGGLLAVWLTKRWGPIRAPRLLAAASSIGLLSVASLALLLRFPLPGLIV